MSTPIPGCWKCPRCGFRLNKRVIFTGDGTVGVNLSAAREVCPNDGATLEQVYESPNDRLVVMGPCCRDLRCVRCGGDGERVIGWRYRDDDRVWDVREQGDRP